MGKFEKDVDSFYNDIDITSMRFSEINSTLTRQQNARLYQSFKAQYYPLNEIQLQYFLTTFHVNWVCYYQRTANPYLLCKEV